MRGITSVVSLSVFPVVENAGPLTPNMFAFRQISAAGIRTQQASLRFVTKGLCSNQPIQNRIADLVKENKIVLFMKGTPDSPMCGFSKAVVQILDIHDVSRQDLSTHNVLEDEEIRQGIYLLHET